MKVRYCLGMTLVALGACGPAQQPQAPTNNTEAPILPAPSAPPAVSNSALAAPAPVSSDKAQPEPKKILLEPKGPIDPKSVEAAGQVVQHYGALIEQGRLTEAAKLWGDPATAAKFTKEIRPNTHLEIGDLGDTEGAAGSIYTTVPVVFYGDGFRKPAQVILRRVNDVPGSTEAQRRWHIERIEWGKAP
nr:hypothetical protein [uncultured bacterium]